MEKCKKRNTEHCTKSKQCDQLGALKMQNIEVLTLKVLIQRFLIKMFLF